MDIVENGNIQKADSNEIISYSYNATPGNQFITRSVNCGTADPFLGAAAGVATGIKTVNVVNKDANINNGAGVPAVFRYYDSTGKELYPDTTPTDFPNIRRINITLAVQTEERDPSTNAYREMIYSTDVLVRNHAIQ
jgi:hypothetical protein